MATIALRANNPAGLTNAQLDANFTNLNNDKVETSYLANTFPGTANITTLGNISTGTWNGSTIAVARGGTGTTTSTGSGSVVLSNSPTLVTPTLGVATATSITASGTITHNGLIPTSGTSIDQIYTTGNITLNNTTWVDVLSGATLPTGSYYVQAAIGTSDIFTGVMSWNSANSTEASTEEIVLQRAGSTASTIPAIFVQYVRKNAAAPVLQVSANGSRTDVVIFKFRRLI